MSPISSILLFAALANLTLLGYVLVRRHTRALHFSFAFLVATISGWILCNFVISLTDSLVVLDLVGRLAFSLAATIAAGYVTFSWRFPETGHPCPPLWLRRAHVGLAALVAVAALSPLVQEAVVLSGGRKQPVGGPLYHVYVVYMVATFCLGTGNLFSSLARTAGNTRERMQVAYALAGFVFSFAFSYLAVFSSPFLPADSEFYLLGAVSPLVWTLTTAYAIFRYRLMDIGVALRNSLVRAVSAALVAVGILVPLLIVGMSDQMEAAPLAFVVAGFASVYALVAPLLQKRLVHFVDHRVFRGRYDHETALVRFGGKLLVTQGRDQIAAVAARELAIIAGARHTAVYLAGPAAEIYELHALWTEAPFPSPASVPARHPLLNGLGEPPAALLREEATYGPAARWGGAAPEVGEMIRSLRLELLVPLVCQERLLGFLVLGEKREDNTFARDEIQLVESLSSQVAFALDNARLYEQVLASSRKYEMILRHIQRAVLAVDERLAVTTINRTGAELLGVSAQTCVGRDVAELAPGLAPLLRQTIQQRSNLPSAERMVERPGGRSFPAECETSVIIDAQDEVVGALLVFHDLTERKRIEEEMRRMDRLVSVGTLAAGVAHEIKNPLVAIQTFAQLLPERYGDEEFRTGFGNVVRAEIARINSLVQDLLDFSGPVRGEVGPLSLHDLVERAENLLRNDLKARNVRLVKEIDHAATMVRGNPEQLYQVVINVLQNAVQAMPESGGTITVATRQAVVGAGSPGSRPVVELSVADTGRGIEKEDLARIFDPFFSRKDHGSGLGLAVCHGILKNHGAEINVVSTPGKGTTFVFAIPAAPEQ